MPLDTYPVLCCSKLVVSMSNKISLTLFRVHLYYSVPFRRWGNKLLEEFRAIRVAAGADKIVCQWKTLPFRSP